MHKQEQEQEKDNEPEPKTEKDDEKALTIINKLTRKHHILDNDLDL